MSENGERMRKFLATRPIWQAPMDGAHGWELCTAVTEAGGLGSLPCAMWDPATIRAELQHAHTAAGNKQLPLNLNFFANVGSEEFDMELAKKWGKRMTDVAAECGVVMEKGFDPVPRALQPQSGSKFETKFCFDEAACEIVQEFKPSVVSFHFGLPAPQLLRKVRESGSLIVCTATSVEEAEFLESAGCDGIIVQGSEAGGYRGSFLPTSTIETQMSLFSLLPQCVRAMKKNTPIIASGGIIDASTVRAALALGATGVQVGTAFLTCPESRINPTHRKALTDPKFCSKTCLTNVYTGRPTRCIYNRYIESMGGPIIPQYLPFPMACKMYNPIKAKAEAAGVRDLIYMYAGQNAPLCHARPAKEVVEELRKGFQKW